MRASIAKPRMECGSLLPLSDCLVAGHQEKSRTGKTPVRPCKSAVSLYRLFGVSVYGFGSDFGSGLLAAGCFVSPCEPACACETSSILVPLSRCTFFPAEVVTDPCVAWEAAALRFRPFRPNTPWLFEVSCPAAFNPPTAPFEAPATLPPAFAAVFTAPPATPPTLAAVLVTVPTAPPAAEVTPPSAPRPPAAPDPPAEAPASPKASRSPPAADPPLCAPAIAWIPALNGISWPFFRVALSNTTPSDDSDSPLARAEACVTCPTSFVPLGITVFPSDFTASVVCALTASPGLHFFESIGELNAALNAVPLANEPFAWPFCADTAVDAEALPDACAFVWPAWTDVWLLPCAPT